MINRKFRFASILFGTLLLLTTATEKRTRAQTATPSPSAEELRLLEEKRLLELQRDIEQAKKAIRDAQPQPEEPPTPTATPLAGDTTLTDVKLEPEIASYKAMSEAVKKIGGEVKTSIDRELTMMKKLLDGDIEKEKDPKKRQRLQAERLRLEIPNLAIYDAQVVKDWRFYQALLPAFEGEVKDLVFRYSQQLCVETDVSQEFKEHFCKLDKTPRLSLEEMGVTAQFLPAAIPALLGAGTSLVKSFIDLAALFRTDTKIEGKTVTIDESALVAELFRALKNDYHRNINLYYPKVFHPRVMRPSLNGRPDASTVTTIGALFLAKLEADKIIAANTKAKTQLVEDPAFKALSENLEKLQQQLATVEALGSELHNLRLALNAEEAEQIKKRIRAEISQVKTKLGKLEAESVLNATIAEKKKKIKETTDKVKPLADKIKVLTDLNTRFQAFVDQFVKVDANGVNAVALFIKSEDIENALPEGNSYWLEIKSVSAGGSNRNRKNLIRFFSGAKIDHSGGVILEYALYKRDGGVIYSDKLTHYEGYVEPKRMRNKPNSKKFEDPIP
jgi:hypothetical protein